MLSSILDVLRSHLGSRKFRVMLVAFIVATAAKLGWNLDNELIMTGLGLVAVFIGAVAYEDGAAKSKPATTAIGNVQGNVTPAQGGGSLGAGSVGTASSYGLSKPSGVDGADYNAGRLEGQADVTAMVRAIVDPSGALHLNLDGVLAEVAKLAPLSPSRMSALVNETLAGLNRHDARTAPPSDLQPAKLVSGGAPIPEWVGRVMEAPAPPGEVGPWFTTMTKAGTAYSSKDRELLIAKLVDSGTEYVPEPTPTSQR